MLAGCGSSESEGLGRLAAAETVAPNLKAAFQTTSDWSSGYCVNVTITNSGAAAASTWAVVLELNQATIQSSWNGKFAGAGSRKTVTPVGWNPNVAVGATLQAFGFCANKTGANSAPTIVSPLGNDGGGTGGAGGAGGTGAGGLSGAGAGGLSGAGTGGLSGAATGGLSGAGTGGLSGAGTGGLSGAGAGGVGDAGEAGEAGDGGLGGAAGTAGTAGTAGAAGTSGYSPTSDYLIDPDKAVPTLKALADFRAKSRDNVNGGFFTFVKRDGTVGNDRRKGFVTTTRDLWTFSRAFMVTGDEIYLEHAAHARDHLLAHGWDTKNGGWYFTGDEYGRLTPFNQYWDPNTWKWSFVQHYALLGLGASCDATREATPCDWLTKGRNLLDTKMWDSNPARYGYYDRANLDMTNPSGKGFTATVDALTTHAMQIDLLWPTAASEQRIVDLANIVTDRLAKNLDLDAARYGFPENYTTNWSVDASQTAVDTGHVLKSAWVLARVYLRHPDARYRAAARKLIYEILNNGGWDEAAGVPYVTGNWSTGQVTKQAECWQIEQAIMSGLSNWYISESSADRDTFLKMADRSLQFFARYVIDATYGGTYKMNNLNGTPTDGVKTNFYNVEYHSTETFYFTYLYGNLMLHRRPIALYYELPAAPSTRVIQLTPVALDAASIEIQSVKLDGVPLSTFSAATREVTLASGQGGKLRVVFGPKP